MRRIARSWRGLAFLSVASAAAVVARAQQPPAGSGQALVAPGRPALATSPDGSSNLPPGHPSMGGQFGVGENPGVKPDSAVIAVRDARGQGVTNIEVRLQGTRKTVLDGEQRVETRKHTGFDGVVEFSGLKPGVDWSYRASVAYRSVEYSSADFGLTPTSGSRIDLTVFEPVSDIDRALVGFQAFLILEPRDEFLVVEHVLRAVNLSDRTWVIPTFVLPLARDFAAFRSDGGGSGPRVEAVEGRGARLFGFVSPGAHEVSFQYEVPYVGDSAAMALVFPMPPRVAQLRIVSVEVRSLRLRIENMPEPIATRGPSGERFLVTDRAVLPGEDQIENATVLLQGFPSPSRARWYVLGLAGFAVAVGLTLAFRKAGKKPRHTDGEKPVEFSELKNRILEEAEALEVARRVGDVGPKTYENSRRLLVDTLSRVIAFERSSKSLH